MEGANRPGARRAPGDRARVRRHYERRRPMRGAAERRVGRVTRAKSPAMRIKPGQIIGNLVHGAPPPTEDGYFYACPDCGQAVDERDLAQVIHHETPDHTPMRLPDAYAVLHGGRA